MKLGKMFVETLEKELATLDDGLPFKEEGV